jgi:hypothetical protein
VQRLRIPGAGAIVIGTAAFVVASTGVASADDGVVGETLAKAKATLSQRGMGVIVGSTVGDRQDRDDCVVTSASKASFLDASGNSTGSNMVVNLNCYATHGGAAGPGYSLGSPEGRASREDQLAEQQKQAAE